ncbi:hypothetical protein Tco_0350264, partial [Tanacetum coccineum]
MYHMDNNFSTRTIWGIFGKADDFRDDYMSVLNDEEMISNVSLDDTKFQHEEENLPVKDTPLEQQPVDELIDAQKDTTNLLPENVK